MHLPRPLAVPVGGTARRPRWPDLPAAVRDRLEQALGAQVVEARSQGSGFTPGFASRLRLADGQRVFVKAAGEGHPWMHEAYRQEAAKLAVLPAAVPAPRLQWVLDEPMAGEAWVVLVFDDIDGRPPHRPWRLDEARSALRTAVGLTETLTPPPTGLDWQPLADVLFDTPPDWSGLGDRPGWAKHASDLAALADRRTKLLAGDTLCHTDLRDDNLIIAPDGTFWVCDWNWPSVGPRWADAVGLAISMYGDGLDAEALLADTGLLAADDREAMDCLLAALTGYFLLWSAKPANPTSPYLRAHQTWYAAVTGGWLKSRRGWT